MMAVANFGIAALKKFQTGRNRAEQVPYGKRGTLWRSRDRHIGKPTIAGADLCPLLRFALAAKQRDIRDRSDTCQRFSPKTKRANLFQIINLGHFAGGMAGQGQRKFLWCNATAVICDADKLQSAVYQINADLCCSRVDAVLDQFFDDRS